MDDSTREGRATPGGSPPVPAPAGSARTQVPGATEPSQAGTPAARRPRRRRKVLSIVLSVVGALLVVVLIAGFVIHLPYVIISPGEATPLDKHVITVNGAPTYGHNGNVLFLTVRVSNHDPTVWRLVTSWLDPDRDIVKRGNAVGCLSDSENTTINARLMQQSQDDAKKVALTRLGYTVDAEPPRITVIEVCAGAPAYHKLMAGDRVLAVDDQPITQLADVGPLVQRHHPGEPATVTYSRNGVTQTATVVTGRTTDRGQKCTAARAGTSGTACLGISTQAFVPYHYPIDVKIDTERVGGPSAGLAFTLAIIDDLTPGNLTGEKRVAVTGTIDSDGKVGPVGGVEQKAITARHNDVSLMIVPRQEVKDARAGAGRLRVVGVGTLDEALAALQRAGGSPVPPAPSAVARS
jgi:PDZ domain-containing protein